MQSGLNYGENTVYIYIYIYITHTVGIPFEPLVQSYTVTPTRLKRSQTPFDNCFQITNTSDVSATAFV